MPLPAGVESVTLNGGANGLRAPDGTARTGTVTLTPSVERVVSTEHGLIVLGPSNATLGASGMFTLGPVLATDADGFEPSGWTYRVDENVTGQPPRTYSVTLPAATPVVALQSLVEVAASDGTIVLVPGGGTPSGTVVAETSYGQAATAGSASAYARGDHTHGTPALPPTGTTAGTYAAGNDSRLSDARTPTAHASTHGSGGSDPVTPAAIGAEPSGTASAAVTTHAGATDPHADRAYANATFATQGTVNTLNGFVDDCLGRVEAIEQGEAFLAGGHFTDDVEVIGADLTVRSASVVLTAEDQIINGEKTFNTAIPVLPAFDAAFANQAVRKALLDAQIATRKAKEPWVFDVTDAAYGAVGDAKVVADGAMSSGSATLTSATAAFTVDDEGKAISVKGAAATGVTTLVTTISAYVSPTQVTLSATNSSGGAVSGAIVIWGTDDTAAIQAAVDAAEAYLAAGHTYAQVYCPPRPYVIAGPLNNSKSGNGQIVFGVYPATGVKKILEFASDVTGAAAVRHWQQLVPQYGGACFVSLGVFASTAAQISSINADGNPAVISGPNEGFGYGAAALFSNVMPVLTNLCFLTTHSAYGLTYGAANLYGCANAHITNFSTGTAGIVAVGSDYSSPGTFGTGLSVGLLLPAPGNNHHVVLDNVSIQGGYTYACFFTEHAVAKRYMGLYCWAGAVFVGNYFGSVGSVHAMRIESCGIEACANEVYILGVGSGGVGPIVHIEELSTESSTPNVGGQAAHMAAARGIIRWTGLFTESGLTHDNPTGIVSTNGQAGSDVRTVTGTLTARPIDRILRADASGGAVTVNLPSAAPNLVEYTIIKADATGNTVTVDPAGSETINGAATRVLSAQWETVTLRSDGTNWLAI
ncbi:hypothetical protein OG864_45550 [Streptomyces sp. NBC_00124]|uniref:hypothetical protein n=1 Tax=Streptomyces sp. NBC_00124 TaxID=2975662 RepID=UPI002251D8AB|nr:hypothetical protein [Streptomyces sp. NBC_00124]MCX5365970.1 hypothetical protein [Streptomyces sp. NBC_00124]